MTFDDLLAQMRQAYFAGRDGVPLTLSFCVPDPTLNKAGNHRGHGKAHPVLPKRVGAAYGLGVRDRERSQ